MTAFRSYNLNIYELMKQNGATFNRLHLTSSMLQTTDAGDTHTEFSVTLDVARKGACHDPWSFLVPELVS